MYFVFLCFYKNETSVTNKKSTVSYNDNRTEEAYLASYQTSMIKLFTILEELIR